jgi:hypothetical protein
MTTASYPLAESVTRWPFQRGCVFFTLVVCVLGLTGCATWQAPTETDYSEIRARVITATVQKVHLSAAVLSTRDSQRIFGANINETGVQPVWIEVKNQTEQTLWLLQAGTDPDYFSPLEVAWSFHTTFSGGTNARIDEYFDARGFKNPIAPGATQTGIIFTNPHHQTRLLNVDLLGQGKLIPFTLFLPVPDDVPETGVLNVLQRIAITETVEYQEEDRFRAALEQMPCCATGPEQTAAGDPLNVILVGDFADIASAFVRRGYRGVALEFDSAQHVFGRPPDIVARKAGQGGVPANWVRMWVTPIRYHGQSVFILQVGRPVGGRFIETESKQLMLHPNVDEVRNVLIQDLLYSGGLGKLGFVTGVGAASPKQPRDSLGKTLYYTDGLRAVMFMVTRPVALSDVQILEWVPALRNLEQGVRGTDLTN